jgi:hypothetical protein
VSLSSPNGQVVATFRVDEAGVPRYAVRLGGAEVLTEAPLGVVREDVDLSRGLRLVGSSPVSAIRDEYEILTAKRRKNVYVANRQTHSLVAPGGQAMNLVMQVSDDGLAFRYEFPGGGPTVHRVLSEATSFSLPAGSRAWLQPMAVAKSGWSRANPSYEEHYSMDIAAGTPSPTEAGWVYPALFRTGEAWLLISEAAPNRSYCVTRLINGEGQRTYRVGFPDAREGVPGGPVAPESTLPFHTPWRVVAIGSLKTIVESTLGIDVADPAKAPPIIAKPGKASWSWLLLQDRGTVFDVQKRFIDYAAEMKWEYCLVDALWDAKIGYDRAKELADHARAKGVGLMLWYNSNGNWNDAPQTPLNKLVNREDRLREFERLRSMGVVGLKVDFFGGDGQSMVGYYLDLLEDAAPFGFAMNFHGATLPRGLQRTYPNLLTVEAIRGEEFVYFEQANAERQPGHVAMLPFTRNVFDPMDFTPMVLDRFPNKRERRTTVGFELASTVLLTSGIQHYAEVPEGMAKMPPFVVQFLRDVPAIWDDSKFVAGHPGKDAVMGRLGNGKWYIAGVNGEGLEKPLTLDLSHLPIQTTGQLITDGDEGLFQGTEIEVGEQRKLQLTVKPHGGFVAVFAGKPKP